MDWIHLASNMIQYNMVHSDILYGSSEDSVFSLKEF
jgi:hypothetical protein